MADSCEAVRHVLAMCCLCTHWICCCLCDAQLLERRQYVRSGLSSSLASLISQLLGMELDKSDQVRSEITSLLELVSRAIILSADQMNKRPCGSARSVTALEAVELGVLARCVRLLDGLCSPFSSRLTVVDSLKKRPEATRRGRVEIESWED